MTRSEQHELAESIYFSSKDIRPDNHGEDVICGHRDCSMCEPFLAEREIVIQEWADELGY